MDRIVGVETEYGCLMSSEELHCNSEVWPAKVKNYLFNKARAGTIDLHYRDYEEPPGNGGFLLNGGRLYLDMGHIEYASPECLHLHDLVTYEMAGDELLRSSLVALEAGDRVTFIKNNVDHHTGATFGCHENYLMKREAQFTPSVLGTLLTFLATRQIFTGAGRVGQANPLAFDFEPPQAETPVAFQLSQRADHIVNDIYQWVQFNRAVLSLLEQRQLPRNLVLNDAVRSTRDISRDPTHKWIVDLENGKTVGALDVQWQFHDLAQRHLRGKDPETDWLLETWSFVLESLEQNPQALIGGVDWITKKWLLETFMASEKIGWDDPWLQSLDLEYHNIDPQRGLFFSVTPGKRVAEWNNSFQPATAIRVPPANTRASGRARAVAYFQDRHQPYVINWDSIAHNSRDFLVMGDPFETYNEEVDKFLFKPRPVTNQDEHE
ncbi:MAG: hypothetical protein DME63_08885 [Verrucomicrobia bacterium]|nr:MAG: hypothetical protein DME63_08885 [Verrucomicrobiota bacterium]